ncbi:amidase family protein [uncultured Anaerotruncus sp.]|uniref:amidase family protein n=1 Tax=uncultured Anaerotruncus sp. TaxID=905011 RepID=UPI00280B0A3D|nr:amidase family protein [uncultured Anaerotruncus sp.]
MPFDFKETTVAAVHRAMLAGEVTCRELAEYYLKRIDAYDQKGPCLNAIILVNPRALEEADRLDAALKNGGLTGPLHGIPVILKDNVDTADMPTTAGSESLRGFTPDEDAFITKRLREAGALILAKSNLHEFAIWGETISSILGQTLNPYDLTRTPGGSSGGTGAAIASDFGILGIGTDTINSIRSPSSACSLVGIRPTIGLVSRGGVVPYSFTQDTAGPICRTVEDAVAVLDVIAGYDPGDDETAWCVDKLQQGSYAEYLKKDGIRGKRIGVLESFFGKKDVHEEVNRVVRAAIEVLRGQGAEIVPITEEIDSGWLTSSVSVHLYDLKDHLNIYLNALPPRAPVHSVEEVMASGKFHPGIRENLEKAMQLSTGTPEYNQRLILRAQTQTKVMKLMADYELDAMVYPHQQQLVCKTGGSQQQRNGVLCSVTGFPSIAVPAGYSTPDQNAPIGVPVGMEIIGRPWSEPTLIEIAYGFQQAAPLRKSPPTTPDL